MTRFPRPAAWLLALSLANAPLAAAEFESHAGYLDGLGGNSALDLGNPADVLEYVLNRLPPLVHVKPTENYAYFKFARDGVVYQGNLRLETEAGAADTLHFAYFVEPQAWHTEEIGQYKAFRASDGVTITAHSRFLYSVVFRGKTWRFALNDASRREAPAGLLKDGEVYMGEASDESGLDFFLVFDREAKVFLWLLDDRAPLLDRLVPYRDEDGQPLSRMSVGLRTGFVFLSEPSRQRRRLAGVYDANIAANTYFDGPFDQLPDSYRGTLSVKQAFALIDPEIAATIDDFGNFLDREGSRIVIAPYVRYWSETSFDGLQACLRLDEAGNDYRACVGKALER